MTDSGVYEKGHAVLTAESPASTIYRLGGGKAAGLYDLSVNGVSVPTWAVVGADVFRDYLQCADLELTITATLQAITGDSSDEKVLAASSRISQLILGAELDQDTRAMIEGAYDQAGAGAVAVRSSGIDEDGETFSFAGQHTTRLNVAGVESVGKAVQECWASAWSTTALRYRLMNGLAVDEVAMAVVIQAMVASQKSGVLFTVNPTEADGSEMLISSSYGLGEAVVSGSVDADTIVLDRETGEVKAETIGAKEQRIDGRPTGGCTATAVAEADSSVLSLAESELQELHREGCRLETIMGGPQDVEWAFVDGELWVLQSRSITSERSDGGENAGETRLWDNSNIIESYGDLVAPLTFSFARHAYHQVYRQYCELLGVPRRQMSSIEEWLPQLLGYFDGRVYYNLLNWYRLSRLIPFYSINRRVLEISIGAEPLDEAIAYDQHPFAFRSRVEGFYVRVRIALRFFWYFATIHRLVDDFVKKFYADYEELNALEIEGRKDYELYAMFVDMERRLLVRWGRMIMLEYSVGLSLGGLYALTQRWLPDAPEWLLFEAIKTEPDVESMEPLIRLDEIAKDVISDAALCDVLLSTPATELDDRLRRSEGAAAKGLVERIDGYFDRFGDRNANELKLEEPDMREDPTAFYTQLQSAIGRLEAADAAKRLKRSTADAYLDEHLRGWRRGIYEALRRRARRCLMDRERVRFCRTRIFGLSRRMFRAAGEEFARVGVLEAPADIFYLRLEELRGCFEGTMGHRELADIVAIRKRQERLNRSQDPPPRFWTRGGIYWDALDRAWAEAESGEATGDGTLRGTPCCAGVITGEAQVMDKPEDAKGGVLVTYRTDPGWVGALRSASALLIERGSPLSHVAVVARELGIPTVVQVPGLTKSVQTGMTVTVDGGTGTIDLQDQGTARGNER